MTSLLSFSRRKFVASGAAALGLSAIRPAWGQSVSHGTASKGFGTLSGPDIDLTIAWGMPLRSTARFRVLCFDLKRETPSV